jgi:small GTP-binding protein
MIRNNSAKVVLIGDSSVGKTSLIQQYHHHIFSGENVETIGASYIARDLETPAGTIQIHIWDTAGQERYRSLIPMYSRNAEVVLLVIDVTNIESFKSADQWLEIVKTHCPPNCRIYVLANKIDLKETVSMDELREWAARHAAPFFKTSAKDFTSIDTVFSRVGNDLGQTVRRAAVTTPQEPAPNDPEGDCC